MVNLKLDKMLSVKKLLRLFNNCLIRFIIVFNCCYIQFVYGDVTTSTAEPYASSIDLAAANGFGIRVINLYQSVAVLNNSLDPNYHEAEAEAYSNITKIPRTFTSNTQNNKKQLFIKLKRQTTENGLTTIAEVAEFVDSGNANDAPSLEITYRVTKSSKNTPREIIDKTLRKAFDKWEEQVDVAFIEAPDDNSKVDLNIRFEDGPHGDKESFDGTGGIASHVIIKNKRNIEEIILPSTGGSINVNEIETTKEMHFDDGDDWTEDSLLKIATAQIGKLLQKLENKEITKQQFNNLLNIQQRQQAQRTYDFHDYYIDSQSQPKKLQAKQQNYYYNPSNLNYFPNNDFSQYSNRYYNNYYPKNYYGYAGNSFRNYGYGFNSPNYYNDYDNYYGNNGYLDSNDYYGYNRYPQKYYNRFPQGQSYRNNNAGSINDIDDDSVDTFYWSNYDSSKDLDNYVNLDNVPLIQSKFGRAKKSWIKNRQHYRNKYGSNYSSHRNSKPNKNRNAGGDDEHGRLGQNYYGRQNYFGGGNRFGQQQPDQIFYNRFRNQGFENRFGPYRSYYGINSGYNGDNNQFGYYNYYNGFGNGYGNYGRYQFRGNNKYNNNRFGQGYDGRYRLRSNNNNSGFVRRN